MSARNATFAFISCLTIYSNAFAAEPWEYITIRQWVNKPRTDLPGLPWWQKSGNDPVAFEVYNSGNRPISCTNLFVDTIIAPIGNCDAHDRTVQVKFRFKKVNLWKLQRDKTIPDEGGILSLVDVWSYWMPYSWNDLGTNAEYYDLGQGGTHYTIHERYDGGEEILEQTAAQMGLTAADVQFCQVTPKVSASECYFGCFPDVPNLREIGNQTCQYR